MHKTLFWQYSKTDLWTAIKLKQGEFHITAFQQYENMILAIGKVFGGSSEEAKPKNFNDAQRQLKALMGG